MTYDNQYQAYQNTAHNAPLIQQLIMLYDGAIRFVQQGKVAIEQKDWESRWNQINKACSIILGLRECLDYQQSPETSEALGNYYESIDTRLVTIQYNNSIELCESVIADLISLRDAWQEIADKIDNGDVGFDANGNPISESTTQTQNHTPYSGASHYSPDGADVSC